MRISPLPDGRRLHRRSLRSRSEPCRNKRFVLVLVVVLVLESNESGNSGKEGFAFFWNVFNPARCYIQRRQPPQTSKVGFQPLRDHRDHRASLSSRHGSPNKAVLAGVIRAKQDSKSEKRIIARWSRWMFQFPTRGLVFGILNSVFCFLSPYDTCIHAKDSDPFP